MRRVALAFGLFVMTAALGVNAAVNEDTMGGAPELRMIGFSPEGHYLAFETYGRSTVTGSPFSEIAVLDTRTNELVPGAPFHAALWGTEWGQDFPWPVGADLVGLVRDFAWVQALSTLQDFGIVWTRAWWDDLEPARGGAGRTVVDVPAAAGIPPVLTTPSALEFDGFRLTARQFPLPQPEHCSRGYERWAGVALDLAGAGAATIATYRDTAIAEYRGCPADYAIREVIVFDGPPAFVVVLLYSFWPFMDGVDEVLYTAIALPVSSPN